MMRRFTGGSVRLGLVFTTVVMAFATARAAERPPNVVMLISDDQAWNDYSFMEHPVIQTPKLDRLARQSALFTRGYVPSSLCRPSLATMITGLYPHQHGITGNDPPKGTDRAKMLKHIAAHPTLPRLLAERGYQSFQSGKWWEGSPAQGGFTAGMTHGDPARGGRHGDEGLKIGRTGMKPVFDFIADCGDKPFFLWYAPFLPHTPHNPPERILKKYASQPGLTPSVAKYYAMCEWFDETCGELLDYLDENKLSDNTLVLYVTDNGWIQQPNSGGYAPRSKRSPNEGGIRTPIMLRWPGHIQPGKSETLVSSIDLAPTILAAAGAPAVKDLPGINLLPVAAGKDAEREALFGEILEHDVADIDNPQASLLYRWCIEGKWKLILSNTGKPAELYDLAADPHENRNLAADHADVVARLTDRIHAWWPIEK